MSPWCAPWRGSAPAPTPSPRARSAGRWPPACRRERIVFSGVGKTAGEIAFALEAGVAEINVESEPELEPGRRRHGGREGVRGRGSRIRVNPDVGAGGHAKISTGHAESKFGVSLGEAERLYAQRASNTAPARAARRRLPYRQPDHRSRAAPPRLRADARSWSSELRGAGLPVDRLDLGGGLGMRLFDQPGRPRRRLCGAGRRARSAISACSWPSSPAG